MTGKGRFVVFEGLDGAGTTTQTGLLAGHLAGLGIDVETTNEPSTGPLGAVLRQALEGRLVLDPVTMALAFAADRTDHLFNARHGVVRSLELGRWVLCDRYLLSSFGYQVSDEIDAGWLASANRHALRPDLTLFIDTPPAVCLARISARTVHRDLFENERALERTQVNYRAALDDPALAGPVVVVDGDRPPAEVFADVLVHVAPLLQGG